MIMEAQTTQVSIGGKAVAVPSVTVDQRRMVVMGKWLKFASVHDEEWIENGEIQDPASMAKALKSVRPRADIFTFAQPFWESEPRFDYAIEWEDVAAVKISTYKDWWESLPQEARKNVRRAGKRGVTVRVVDFDDAFVAGIKQIYDETPIRQGRKFWHYGKDLSAVKRENATFLDRSAFVAAYFNDELIGFIKIVFVGKTARIMQIISKNAHFDKRPPNALIAKAMETCCERGAAHFVYGKYFYGGKGDTAITEFKRRNGFERMVFPRYYVPLTMRGRAAIGSRLHLGVKRLIPRRLTHFLLDARAKFYQRRLESAGAGAENPAKLTDGVVEDHA